MMFLKFKAKYTVYRLIFCSYFQHRTNLIIGKLWVLLVCQFT